MGVGSKSNNDEELPCNIPIDPFSVSTGAPTRASAIDSSSSLSDFASFFFAFDDGFFRFRVDALVIGLTFGLV